MVNTKTENSKITDMNEGTFFPVDIVKIDNIEPTAITKNFAANISFITGIIRGWQMQVKTPRRINTNASTEKKAISGVLANFVP